MHEKRKASISVILVMVFVLGLFTPMSQHARAAIPVPHNTYGHAIDSVGVGWGDGELVSSWIDGVMYGWNLTFTDWVDPDDTNRSSKYDIDTAGNQITIPGNPDTPWVKEGGDQGVDDIMYVFGDMTETTVVVDSPSNVFEQTAVWMTFDFYYDNLTIAPTQPPALPKISIIVTQPGAGTQYIYIYGPQGTSMDEFYLEKNDGVLHNVATQIFLSGTISETTYFYVDLGATDYIDPLGDELKLVWENPGGPGTPFGGMDVVVDRVEYNDTMAGTHFGEPDNTIMYDASAGSTMWRTPNPYTDTNDCLADFAPGAEPGRPPLAPYPLSVEGVKKGPGQVFDHVVNRVNPNLDFNFTDDGPFQFGYHMEVANDSAFTAIRWASYQIASTANNEDYAGPALTPGVCYYYRAKTKDAYDYGPWANTTMCMNTPPPIPENVWPHNETVPPLSLNISWNPVNDTDLDPVNYELNVDDDPFFGSPLPPYFGPDPWYVDDYAALTNYSWRVRAHDGYEYSLGWSNESGYWWFNTTNPPIPPVPVFLAIEGDFEFSPGAEHLTNRVNPVLNWTFTDGNLADSQAAYDLEIRDAPVGMGNLVWSDSGGTAEQVTYAGPQLSECLDYYFRVMVQDDSADALWSLDWAEMKFHSNCVPSIPDLLTPPNDAILTQSDTQVVDWDSSTDLDPFPFDTITYEWVVDEDCPATVPYVASGTTPSTFSDQFVTVIATHYNWTVRAYDGWEYSDWAVCFHFYVEVPNQRPGPALNLAVDGFTAAPEITHLLNPTPTFSWTFNDPDVGDTQADIHVIVSTGPGGTGVIWDYNESYMLESIDYGGGISPEPCNGYYFGISTADNNGWWARTSDWSEIYFHLNCAPTEPQPSLPADGAVVTPSATETVTWLASTDADVPPDTITYTVQVDDSAAMTAPFVLEEMTTGTTSSGFDTTGLGCFWWRVNATDGWESSIWSTTFSFCANNAPGLPDGLAVQGFMSGADLMHILVAEPAFNWTFVDPDAGDTQTAYDLEVWTGPGATGTSMWTYSGGTALTVNYNADSTALALIPGDSYYFRVRTMDAYEFGGWEELQFEMSAAPPAPALTTPADAETDVSLTPTLTWAGVTDPNGDTVTYHWYVDTDATPTAPFTDNNTTAGTTATLSVTLTGFTPYYWMVCADDGWEQPQCSTVWSFTTTAPPNQPPVADAGVDQNVVEGTNVTLVGTGTDPDGTIVLYEWDFTTDGTYDTTNTTSGTTTHIYTVPETYNATLRVTDDDGATDTDNVTITVTEAANLLPEADAGDDQEVDVDQAVTLSGSGTDTDGTIVLYEWDFENDGTWDWNSTTTGVTTQTYTSAGTFTARLRVTDNDGDTDTDDAIIEVKEKEAEADFLSEYWWLLLIIIIIVILVIILLAKRKKPEEEEEEPAEEEEEAPPEEEPEEAPEEEEAAEEEKADMKECPNCGTVLASDDAECFMCGAKV